MFRLNTGRSYRGYNVVPPSTLNLMAVVNYDSEVRSGGSVI
jgi:hypothetical protein